MELQWSPLSTAAVFAAQGDRVAEEDVARRGTGVLAQNLSKLSDSELGASLAQATIDPFAARFMHLPVLERARQVAAAKSQIQ